MSEVLEERKKRKKRKKKKKKGLWDNIWARRRAGKRPKRPGEKGYPKTLKIESSELDNLRKFIIEAILHEEG
jgi:hypothetical protein